MKKILAIGLIIGAFIAQTMSPKATNKDISTLNLSSKNYILYDVNNEIIINEKNSKIRLSTASINKVLTTITALDLLKDENLDKEITVYPESLHYLDREASKAGLEANQIVTLREVLYAIMLPSGADATALMSLYLFNTQDGLVDAMNEKAKEIGMIETNIENTAGLDDPNQYTTLEDLLTLLRYALQNEDFKDIYSKDTYTFKHGDLTIENPILMMAQQQSPNYMLGAKSGYTLNAQRSLSSVASNGVDTYIFISTQAKGGQYEGNMAFADAQAVYEKLFTEAVGTEEKTVSNDSTIIPTAPDSSLNIAQGMLNISTFIILFLIFIIIVLLTLRMINIRKMKKRRKSRFL